MVGQGPMTPRVVNKPTFEGSWEYYCLIWEYNDYSQLIEPHPPKPTYRIGPYPTYEDATDMYYQAYQLVKPEVDEIGRELYWNLEIEEVEYKHEPSCQC